MDVMMVALDEYMESCSIAFVRDSHITSEMSRVKKNAIRKIETIVNPKYALHAARAFCKAYHEGCYEADLILLYELEITEEEIYAIEDNFEGYKAHFEKNYKIEEPEDGYSF